MAGAKKLAIFDFDGTIYKFQSPDQFADYVAPKNLRTSVLEFICKQLAKSPKYDGIHHKKAKLLKIKGLRLADLEAKAKTFVNEVLLTNLIPDAASALEKYSADPNFDVLIVSAGYDIYLKYFCKLKSIPLLAATNIQLHSGVATGKMDGIDCYGAAKITKMKEIMDLNQYDLANSVCYSDSKSDMPIFNLVGNKYFVYIDNNSYKIKTI